METGFYKVEKATFYVPSVVDKQESEQKQKPAQHRGRSVSNASDNTKSLTTNETDITLGNEQGAGARSINVVKGRNSFADPNPIDKNSIQVLPLDTSQLPTTMKVIDRNEAAKQQGANSSTNNNPNLQHEDDQEPIYATVNKQPKK